MPVRMRAALKTPEDFRKAILRLAEAMNIEDLHDITSTTYHESSATSGQILKADANGLPVDASNTDTEVATAVTKTHDRSHVITATADHTSTATAGQMLKADANGLPVDATNTDADVGTAVMNEHIQNTDIGTSYETFTVDALSAVGKIIIDPNESKSPPADWALTITNTALTANRTVTFPDETGTVALEDNISTITADPTLGAAHDSVFCNAVGAPFAVTVPLAASYPGKKYTIKKIDSSANAITVTRSGADVIDGASTLVIGIQYASATIQSDGTASWWIV